MTDVDYKRAELQQRRAIEAEALLRTLRDSHLKVRELLMPLDEQFITECPKVSASNIRKAIEFLEGRSCV